MLAKEYQDQQILEINVHDAIFAAHRYKTKKWLEPQLAHINLNDNEHYKKPLLEIVVKNENWFHNLSAEAKEGPNHEENGIEEDFQEYIKTIFAKYSEGSTGKETLFWLLENISKLEGESKQAAEDCPLTTLNMARLTYDDPTNIFLRKRYSCMPGLDDRLIDTISTYIPIETKIAQETFIEKYYRIAVISTIQLLPKMFIDAHNEMFNSDMQYSEAYKTNEANVIRPLKNKVCEMFGINNFYLEHLLSVSGDNELWGMFAYIELDTVKPTKERDKEEGKEIAEINKIDAKSLMAAKLAELKTLQKNNYDSENLKDKHIDYLVRDRYIEDQLVLNITNNIDSYIDSDHHQQKYLPCQEELIITLVNRERFEVNILKKLFLASLKAGFSNLAETILDKLTAQNQHLDSAWPSIAYAVKYNRYKILQTLFNLDLDVDIKDQCGGTPLMYAAINDDVDTLNVLLLKGADIEVKDRHGNTPLMVASKAGYTNLIEMLLDHKVKLYKNSALHKASYLGDVEKITRLLANGDNINAQNINGDTPLHYAAMSGHLQAAIALLKKDADILIKNNKGYSVVFTSLMNGHVWMFLIMLFYHIRAMFISLNHAEVPANKTESTVFEPIDLANVNLEQGRNVLPEPENYFKLS